MTRDEMLARVTRRQDPWDIIVVGGGATGAGIAVDAASRGYAVLLLEAADFGKGTSSRSTKLVHGGVRYLQQGNISLVREALRERSILRRNAPHLVSDLSLVVPAYAWWERPYYGIGLKLYDLLARDPVFGGSTVLSRAATIDLLPTVQTDGLRGGIRYHDGQFDDARLLVTLVQTAIDLGATVVNYVRVIGLNASDGTVDGVVARDEEAGTELRIAARIVINATGAFVDELRQMADPARPPLVAPSQGTHIVLDRRFLPGDVAMMVPRVGDGRVMFAIPWHSHVLIGTTDTPLASPAIEPRPLAEEVDALLRTASRYLSIAPAASDVLSVFTGVRPLVRRGDTGVTAALSRDHVIEVNRAALVTTTGGKWTTYRHMAEQTVDRAAQVANLPQRPSATASLRLHGYATAASSTRSLAHYGSDETAIRLMLESEPDLRAQLDPELPCTAAEIVWAVRHEMARTVEDVLARRCRALFLNAAAARRMAPVAAELMARELDRTDGWIRQQLEMFDGLTTNYSAASLLD